MILNLSCTESPKSNLIAIVSAIIHPRPQDSESVRVTAQRITKNKFLLRSIAKIGVCIWETFARTSDDRPVNGKCFKLGGGAAVRSNKVRDLSSYATAWIRSAHSPVHHMGMQDMNRAFFPYEVIPELTLDRRRMNQED